MESQTRRTLKATEPDVPQHPHHQSGTYGWLESAPHCFDRGGDYPGAWRTTLGCGPVNTRTGPPAFWLGVLAQLVAVTGWY